MSQIGFEAMQVLIHINNILVVLEGTVPQNNKKIEVYL